MGKVFKARDYHDNPIASFEFADGARWRVRWPLFKDRHALQELSAVQRARLQARVQELREEAEKLTEESGDDAVGRELISDYQDPVDLTSEYLHAEVLALFIDPPVTAQDVMERVADGISLDALYEAHGLVMEAISGESAKKRKGAPAS